MKIGLGSYALAWAIGVPGYPPEKPLDVFGFVDKAAQYGFPLVQIADNLPLHTLKKAELGRLAAQLVALDLKLELGTRGLGQTHLQRYLELAQSFGSPILRVVTDSGNYHPALSEVYRSIEAVLPSFADANVALAIENHDRFKARELLDLVSTFKSLHLGICLDTVNSFGALEGPDVVIDTLAPYVLNIHIKDFKVIREPHNLGFRIVGTPAGQGVLDIPLLLEKVKQEHRTVNAILESWPAPELDLEATLRKEAQWVAESAAYLHSLLQTNQ